MPISTVVCCHHQRTAGALAHSDQENGKHSPSRAASSIYLQCPPLEFLPSTLQFDQYSESLNQTKSAHELILQRDTLIDLPVNLPPPESLASLPPRQWKARRSMPPHRIIGSSRPWKSQIYGDPYTPDPRCQESPLRRLDLRSSQYTGDARA